MTGTRNPAPMPVLPAGACDCHFHAIGSADRYPLAAERSYTPDPAPESYHAAIFQPLGVSRGVVVQPSVYGTDNSCLLDALKAAPQRLRGVAVIDDASAPLAEYDAAGVRAIRFNLRMKGGVALDRISGLAAAVARFGWHLEINQNAEMLPSVPDLLAKLPEGMPVVLDHMAHVPVCEGAGGAAFQSLLRLLGGGRIWVKLAITRVSAAAPYGDVAEMVRRLAQEAPERCLWGSDWPHVNTPPERLPDNRRLVEAMASWLETEEIRRQVFSGNPAALYGFGG